MQNYLQQPQFNYRPLYYKALPIANDAEMNNVTVDFNGTPTYFHNQMTNEIYVKQFDMRTGLINTQKFVKFEAVQKPDEEKKEDLYKEELNAIYGKINGLEETIKSITKSDDIKGVKNAK